MRVIGGVEDEAQNFGGKSVEAFHRFLLGRRVELELSLRDRIDAHKDNLDLHICSSDCPALAKNVSSQCVFTRSLDIGEGA